MTLPELVSRSSSQPHSQLCQRSSNVFLRIFPHPEQIWLVYLGSTNTVVRPAHAALTLTSVVKILQPASAMDLFSPAFAAAPLGKYCPVSSSCFGLGALIRLA